MQVFLAMTLRSLDEQEQVMGLLLHNLAETSSDPEIASYKEAILFYTSRLNQTP